MDSEWCIFLPLIICLYLLAKGLRERRERIEADYRRMERESMCTLVTGERVPWAYRIDRDTGERIYDRHWVETDTGAHEAHYRERLSQALEIVE